MKVFERLVNDLMKEEALRDYKFRKSDSCFIRKFDWGFYAVELDHWNKWGDCYVSPNIGFHYNIIVKWFEKYSTLTLRDQRNNFLSFMNPTVIGLKGNYPDVSIFEMKSDGSDYEKISKDLIHAIIESVKWFEAKYKTLKDYYNYDVAPYLRGEKKLPIGGASWFFDGLTACRIVAPQDYERLKELFLAQAKWMMCDWKYAPEPNMVNYYHRLDEILSDMESRFPIKNN